MIALSPNDLPADWKKTVIEQSLIIASYCNDPICKARESYCELYIPNESNRSFEQIANQIFLIAKTIFFTIVSLFSTPIGLSIRTTVTFFSSNNFLFLEQKNRTEKIWDGTSSLTFYLGNVCCMPAGYSITDGGILPPSNRTRLDRMIEKMKEKDPDIICLMEVEDICDANYFTKHLENYRYIIPVAGFRGLGPSSMIYIASRYKIEEKSIRFIPFIKGKELTGRAQFSEKGILSFDLITDQKNSKLSILATHLQHSEEPERPTDIEKVSRKKQCQKIEEIAKKKLQEGGQVVLMGDLNQEEEELNCNLTMQWLRDHQIKGKATWGGDAWCSRLQNKKSSKPLVLDYFLTISNLIPKTTLIEMEYNAENFDPKALSDHLHLITTLSKKEGSF